MVIIKTAFWRKRLNMKEWAQKCLKPVGKPDTNMGGVETSG